jgi:cytochrome P450 PksS
MTDRFATVRIDQRGFKRDPHPFYDWMRAEAPIGRVRLPLVGQAWVVARHADVAALLKDSRLAKDRANAPPTAGAPAGPPFGRLIAPLMNGMLDKDDPDHARLRRLAQAAFTPRRVERMADDIATISEDLLGRLKGRTEWDVIADYALPLPVIVISRLLGVDPADQPRFVAWSRALINAPRSPVSGLIALPRILAFMRFVRRLIAERRARPRDDLISALAEIHEGGARLSEDELLSMIILLLTAGHETTTNLIGNGIAALLAHQDQAERLRAEPALIDTAVEELLRFAPPVETSTFRYAREDMVIAGQPIRRGDAVLGLIAAANRDDGVFPDPHRLVLARPANRHLTFGMGGHYCLGAPLARLEARIALPHLLNRFPDLALARAPTDLAWRPGLVLRGLERLPVRTGRRR